MSLSWSLCRSTSRLSPMFSVRMMSAAGSGGSGFGDKAGSIREAGGAFGKKEKAQEDQYFRRKEAEQLDQLAHHLEDLKSKHHDEIAHHEEAIKRHQAFIDRHKKKIVEIDQHQAKK